MGVINSITCKKCKYHAETREGGGFFLFAQLKRTEKALLNGEIQCDEALECLQSGGELANVAAYLCPDCKEFKTSNQIFCLTNIKESPFGTYRYDVLFPFGKPKCEICDSELVYIQNIRSSKVKCPKCGGELNAKIKGYYD